MKFCQNCGKELLDEAVVCTGCGCPIQVDAENNSDKVLDEVEIQKRKIKN
mgnify:CR=1 FL=1